MSKHTTGKWTVANSGRSINAPGGKIAANSVAAVHSISHCRGWSSISELEADANARLIAAAPLLLEALESILHQADDHELAWVVNGQAPRDEWITAGTLGQTAITAATGEEPGA